MHLEASATLLIAMIAALIWRGTPQPIEAPVLREEGFLGVKGHLRLPLTIVMNPETTNHPSYRALSLRAARWRIFRKSLPDLAARGLASAPSIPRSARFGACAAGSLIDRECLPLLASIGGSSIACLVAVGENRIHRVRASTTVWRAWRWCLGTQTLEAGSDMTTVIEHVPRWGFA